MAGFTVMADIHSPSQPFIGSCSSSAAPADKKGKSAVAPTTVSEPKTKKRILSTSSIEESHQSVVEYNLSDDLSDSTENDYPQVQNIRQQSAAIRSSVLRDVTEVLNVEVVQQEPYILVQSHFLVNLYHRVGRRTKFAVSEFQRRVGPPENLKLNTILRLLRKGKNKGSQLSVEKFMSENGIEPADGKQIVSPFTELLEEDSATLAKATIETATEKLPIGSVASSLLHNLETTTNDPLRIKCDLKASLKILEGVMRAVNEKKGDFGLATHELGPEMMNASHDIIEQVIKKAIATLDEIC